MYLVLLGLAVDDVVAGVDGVVACTGAVAGHGCWLFDVVFGGMWVGSPSMELCMQHKLDIESLSCVFGVRKGRRAQNEIGIGSAAFPHHVYVTAPREHILTRVKMRVCWSLSEDCLLMRTLSAPSRRCRSHVSRVG